MTKDELERKVAEMGGIFVQNPGRHFLIDKKDINSEHFSGWHSLIKACYLCSFLLMRYEISSKISRQLFLDEKYYINSVPFLGGHCIILQDINSVNFQGRLSDITI